MEHNGNLEWPLPEVHMPSDIDDMELYGYEIHNGNEPSDEMVQRVKKAFEQSPKYRTESLLFCRGGEECSNLVIPEEVRSYSQPQAALSKSIGQIKQRIEGILGRKLKDLVRQGPVIVEFIKNSMEPPLRRGHPSRDNSVSIYCPLGESARWNNGLFEVYTTSHHQEDPEEFQNSPKQVHRLSLNPGQYLIVKGRLRIKPSPNGGAQIAWLGYSIKPMHEDIDSPEAFEFMQI
ncbi:hypothetical protein SI65_06016 [Aspergillus cristatus]|uniref:Uncharacterized protein n=1 Tax=Aspergillus cristatus TaxID=573508 RepID=A0A1E3BB05_ASPCR|nr:hypothetical protein SI65_06016 [Aspergillus cristatus]